MTLPRKQRFRGGDRVVYLGGSDIPQHEGATGTVKGKPQQGRTGYGHFVRFDEGGTELVSEERLRSEIGQHRLAAMKIEEMEEKALGEAHYWLRNPRPRWISVTKEMFMRAEELAGFNSSGGSGTLATAGFASGDIEGKITHGEEVPSSEAVLAPPDTAYHDLALVYGQVAKLHQLMVDLGIAINRVNAGISHVAENAQREGESDELTRNLDGLEWNVLGNNMDEVNNLYVEFQAQLMELGREKETDELAQDDQNDQTAQAAPTMVPEDAQEDDRPGGASHGSDASAKPAQ